MEKKELKDLIRTKEKELYRSDLSNVMKLKDGSVIKIMNPGYIELLKNAGINLEDKILDSENISLSPRIIKPTSAIYIKDFFIGYQMDEGKGVDLNKFGQSLTINEKGDLNLYANIYSRIENIVKNSPNVVFPDLATFNNILIDSSNCPSLCDYDSFQIGKHQTGNISSSLGSQRQYDIEKYRQGDYFTKELDKKSLITLYFYMTFGIDLGVVGEYNPIFGGRITLDYFFDMINLQDSNIINKTYKTFNDKESNEYLGDDVFKLAEENKLIVIPLDATTCIKSLVKK